VNHGVSSSLLEQLKHEIEEFYNLPLEDKRKYMVRPDDFQGYGNTKLDEILDWGDRFYMITNPIHHRKPHLFPELPPSFRSSSFPLYLPSFLLWSVCVCIFIFFHFCMQESLGMLSAGIAKTCHETAWVYSRSSESGLEGDWGDF
jgi:hypothetical protein